MAFSAISSFAEQWSEIRNSIWNCMGKISPWFFDVGDNQNHIHNWNKFSKHLKYLCRNHYNILRLKVMKQDDLEKKKLIFHWIKKPDFSLFWRLEIDYFQMGFIRINHCVEVCRCAAPTILFPAAKRPAFVYNQHGFIRKETGKATNY